MGCEFDAIWHQLSTWTSWTCEDGLPNGSSIGINLASTFNLWRWTPQWNSPNCLWATNDGFSYCHQLIGSSPGNNPTAWEEALRWIRSWTRFEHSKELNYVSSATAFQKGHLNTFFSFWCFVVLCDLMQRFHDFVWALQAMASRAWVLPLLLLLTRLIAFKVCHVDISCQIQERENFSATL